MKFRTWFLAVILAAPSSFAQESLRPDVPVAIVGGKLLDGYEAQPIHHSVVVFENGRVQTDAFVAGCTLFGIDPRSNVFPIRCLVFGTGGRC